MNELQVFIKKSGIDEENGLIMLDNFQHYEQVAAEWLKQAETIVVTDGSQKEMIRKAREGRIILRDKRIEVEKRRKAMKESSLRKGQAIDAVAKFLKDLITPIEEYLDAQERFVQIKEAKEKAEREEQERLALVEKLRLEDEARRKAEAEEKERLQAEVALLKEEKRKTEEALAAGKRIVEEREAEIDLIIATAAKKEADLDEDIKVLQAITKHIVESEDTGVECPECHHRFFLYEQK